MQGNSDLSTFLSFYYNPKASPQQPKNVSQFIEINPNKFMYINLELDDQHKTQLTELLERQVGSFTWDYSDMKGIILET